MLAFWNSIQLRCNLLSESFWLETSSKRTWRIFFPLFPYFKHILQAHPTIWNSSVHTISSYIASISIWENNPESIIWYCIFFWVREALELQLRSLILSKGSCFTPTHWTYPLWCYWNYHLGQKQVSLWLPVGYLSLPASGSAHCQTHLNNFLWVVRFEPLRCCTNLR